MGKKELSVTSRGLAVLEYVQLITCTYDQQMTVQTNKDGHNFITKFALEVVIITETAKGGYVHGRS